MNQKKLISILGPTASGKTSLAVAWAKKHNTVVISCDSRQFFKEMSIGTALPSVAELDGVTHYFLGHKSITEDFSAGDYEREALALLEQLFQEHDVVIQVGGSGLYAHALMFGLPESPPKDEKLRAELNERVAQEGIAFLQELLQEKDPEYCATADLQNPQRLIRAAEVILSSGRKFSSFKNTAAAPRSFVNEIYGIFWEREALYDRINTRVDQMVAAGLLNEVKGLLPYRELNALNTVGYKEVFDYLDGSVSWETAVEEIKKNTRRYAKRQMTWFNKTPGIQWIKPN